MSYVQPIPPLRALPQGRLALRSQHLRAELGRPPERTHRRRKALVLVAAAVVLAATLLATPALGLRDGLAHLFGADKPPPYVIQHYFTNEDPLGVKGLLPAKARLVSALAIPGFGHMTIWAAPTKDGGFCSTAGSDSTCKPHGTPRFDATLIVTGPTSRKGPDSREPRDVHVIVRGITLARGAANLTAHYEDGTVERTPISWVGKPIGAGFFLYEIPQGHWEPGKRLIALAVENADGRVLTRDTKLAGEFRDVQKDGLALPTGAHPKPLPPPPQPTYSKTFSDREGDAGSSVDITEVKVTEWAREIDVELTVKGNPGLQEDGPLVALDLDQNPDTGSAFYGTEAEVALVGGGDTPTLYKAHGWDFLAARPSPSGIGWMTGSEKVGFLIPRASLGPDPEPAFNIVASSVARHPDTAPDVGTFHFEPPGSTHPPLGADRRPPKLLAFDSLGTHGKDAKLDYWVLEGRGKARQVIRVFRGHRLLKTIWTPIADANPFGTAETTWHVPPKLRGRLRFTVRSFDAAGNRSTLASAALIVR